MLLALTRESSLHSPGAGMNPVLLVTAPDAFLFTSSRRQKTLLSVFEFSFAYFYCSWSALVTATSVQSSLYIYFLIAVFVMSGFYAFRYLMVYNTGECFGRVRSWQC